MKKRLSQYHPILYFIAVKKNQFSRYIQWYFSTKKYADEKADIFQFPYKVKDHKLLLLRRLGTVDMSLQQNKVVNLKLMAPLIDSVVIKPGQYFSIWKLTGKNNKKNGYKEALTLKGTEVSSSIGGGVCQMANLIHWMALHSQLQVVERFHHSLDFFPDNNRKIPFGTGAAIMYNYMDLELYNPSSENIIINISVGPKYLEGSISSDTPVTTEYKVVEKNQYFKKIDNVYFRFNEIWREDQNNPSYKELLFKNKSRVIYNEKFIPKDLIKMNV